MHGLLGAEGVRLIRAGVWLIRGVGKSVLQSTSLYYNVIICSTKDQFVLVLQSTSLYYRIRICTTE